MHDYTSQIEPVIEPDRGQGELGVFNPTACFDRSGMMQVLYRLAGPSRVTRLTHSLLVGGQFIRQKPISIQVDTGDPQTDSFITAALLNSEEDPRFIRLPDEDGWFVTIVGLRLPAYSNGQMAITVLAKVNNDFERYEIFRLLTPSLFDDRHVIPLPERVDGNYGLLTRPQKPGKESYVDFYTGQSSSVYLARTPDLSMRPGDQLILSPRQPWEARRIGGVGPQPVLTRQGWLAFYMAVDLHNRYSVGAFLLDPHTLQVTARSPNPLLAPDDAYNRRFPVTNFGMPNVIFATTALIDEGHDSVTFLVGCNDIAVGRVVMPLSEIFDALDHST